MKKLINLSLCVFLFAAVLLSACSSGNTPSETPTTTQASTEASTTQESAATDTLDKYPEKPIVTVVAWAPGGATDLMVRAIAKSFKNYSNGQPLLVTNLEGGASVQGVAEYLTFDPNGYNMLTWATAQTVKTHMQKTPYSALDFKPVSSFVSDSPYILVSAKSPFKTVADLVKYAKDNPGKLTIGNSGAGGGNHLAALQFSRAAGIEANHIAYAGGGPSAQATLSGEVDCSMNVPAEGLASVESGDLRMLTILSEKRSAYFPDVPTAKESGIDVVNIQTRGFVLHKDTPDGVAQKLESIFKQLVTDEEFKKTLAGLNMNIQFMGIDEYGAALKEEDTLFMEIIQANKLGDRY